MKHCLLFLLLPVIVVAAAGAADLPPHPALRILIVSDTVNPHELADSVLTQHGDLSPAILAPDSGLSLDPAPDGVREIHTDDLSDATAALGVPFAGPDAYDVLIYFSHRIPVGGGGAALQSAFDTAVEAFLTAGGGMVAFHHGSYLTTGKEGIQDLIGATAMGSVPWDTLSGQNVINVRPGHFVTTNGVSYTASVNYVDLPRGVALGQYDLFNNTPDERYINFEINPGAPVEVLFGSDYVQNGGTHLLGFIHQRPEWAGLVVGYQPGEYQPNAVDDRNGNNFQILANAIVFAALDARVGVPEAGPPLPPLELSPANNPFRTVARLVVALPDGLPGTLEVFDIRGRLQWATRLTGTGASQTVTWDTRDAWGGRGGRVPAGVYFARLRAGQVNSVVRLLRLP